MREYSVWRRVGVVLWFAGLTSCVCAPSMAQRRPVLPQIDLPHPYYYRELYLPQLTSGPSSAAWSPDSSEVVYSMAGSLWRQRIDSKVAQQLTDGAGYDYQPDWAPDGKSVVYVSYQKDAMELWMLDVATGKSHQLTEGGAVNLEPRFSPDGKRIVFVSTTYNKRFHIFRADVREGRLENVVRLTGETKSPLPRYYYSAYDTEINPVWTRDGAEILFVSNRGRIHGTGGFWRMRAEPGADAREKFIMKKRTGGPGRTFLQTDRAWFTARTWGGRGISFGSCLPRVATRFRFRMAIGTRPACDGRRTAGRLRISPTTMEIRRWDIKRYRAETGSR
jgi:TolB protein